MSKIFRIIIFLVVGFIDFSCMAQTTSPMIEVLSNEELLLKQILPCLFSGKNAPQDFFDSARELARLKLVCCRFNQLITIENIDLILKQAGIRPELVPAVYLLIEEVRGSNACVLRALINDKMDVISRERDEQNANTLSRYSIYALYIFFSTILLVIVKQSVF